MLGRVGIAYGRLGRVASALNPIMLTGNTVPENSANGTSAGSVSLRPGHTGTPVWSLTDATGTFQINSGTGAITVLSNTLLDYEARTSIPITISVSGVSPAVGARASGIGISNVIETPVNVSAPVISGSAVVGSILTLTDYGQWTDMVGPGAHSFALQWNNGSDIVGATSTTYTVASGDTGLNIVCKVTPTNTAGTGAAASSNSIGPIGSVASLIVDEAGNVIVDESGNQILA